MFQLSYLQYANCKRLADDGNCAEALDGIELLSNNLYKIVKDQKLFERCAIVNETESECLFPRFGFVLDVITKRIFRDTSMTFCAFFDSDQQICLKFQQRFVRQNQTQQGVYLGEDFINPDKLVNKSTNQELICESDFDLNLKYLDQFEGCLAKFSALEPNENLCSIQQAMRDDKSKCEVVIPFCQEYMEISGKQLCIKCFPFYKLHLQTCIRLNGCTLTSTKNPNNCILCDKNFILSQGECDQSSQRMLQSEYQERKFLEKTQIDNYYLKSQNQFQQFKENILGNQNFRNEQKKRQLLKYKEIQQFQAKIKTKNFKNKHFILEEEPSKKDLFNEMCIYNSLNQCFKCVSYDNYYLDIKSNQCLTRERSVWCKYKIYNSDNCQKLICDEPSNYNFGLFEDLDLNNIETLNYINYIVNKVFEIDQIITDSEIINLSQKYKFYGISYDKNIQICFYLPKKDDEFIYLQYPNFNKCKNQEYKLIDIIERKYLKFKCSNYFIIKNIHFEKCVQYDHEKSFCLECENGFYFNQITMSCQKKIENCLIHSKYLTCVICQSGHKLVKQIKCEPICGIAIPGAQKYYYSFYQYEKGQIICKKTDVPCKKFFNEKCIECFEGFILDQSQDNACLKDVYFPDCKVIDKFQQNQRSDQKGAHQFEEKICIQCQEGYVLFEGLCFCQKVSCLHHFYCDSKRCMKKFRSLLIGQLNLEENQYLEKYGNFYKVLTCNIVNCLMCYEGNICIKCRYGYQLDKKKKSCVYNSTKIIDLPTQKYGDSNCEQYLLINEQIQGCKLCKQEYYLMQDFNCYQTCPPEYIKYFLFNDSALCYQCPVGCKQCQFFIFDKQHEWNFTCSFCHENFFYYPQTKECKRRCIYFIKQDSLNVNKKGLCVESCNPDYQIDEKTCTTKCPKFYMTIKGNNQCAESCEGLYKYEDIPLKCIDQCQEGYYSNEEQLLCKKCQVENCLKCDKKQPSYCYQCQKQFFNNNGSCIFKCLNFEFYNDLTECKYDSGYLLFCKEQNQGKCLQCAETFILDEYKIKCICPAKNFIDWDSQCRKSCDNNCKVCLNELCLECQPNKIYFKENLPPVCIDKCPPGYFLKMGDKNYRNYICVKCQQECLTCNNEYSCIICKEPYQAQSCGDSINVICQNPGLNSQQLEAFFNNNKCCFINNCMQCIQNRNICEKCNFKYPYLYLNSCLQYCPDGTYPDNLFQCQKCHTLCKTCSNELPKSCITCSLPQKFQELDGSCRCTNKQFFLKSQCYSSCPRFTKVIDNNNRMCQEWCIEDNSYPIFNDEGLFESCESNLNLESSKFCEQNIINLDKYITIQLKNTPFNGQHINTFIIVTVQQVPQECYDFKLKSNIQENDLNLELKDYKVKDKLSFEFKLQSKIELSQLQQADINQCKQNKCTLFLQIYLRKIKRKTIKFTINLQSQVVKKQSIQLVNLDYIQRLVIKQKELDSKQNIDSIMLVDCQDYIICNNQSIIAFPSTLVLFHIISFSDDKKEINKQFVLVPILAYLIKKDQTQQKIEEIFFNNNIPSQIKIEFNFNQVFEGNLVFQIKVIESNNNYLDYVKFVEGSKQSYYIEKSVNIIIQNKQNLTENKEQTNQNDSQLYQIMFIFNIVIFILIITLAIIRLIKKNEEKNLQFHEKEENQEQNQNLKHQNQIQSYSDFNNEQFEFK